MRLIPAVTLPIALLPAMLAAAPAWQSAPASSSQAEKAVAAPVLKFSPATLELGELVIGTPGRGTLTITNASDAPITIEAIKAGCGCTKVSDPPKGPIAPGASFTVDVTLDPGTKPGVELVKPVHVLLAGGRTESMQVKARVKPAEPGTAYEVESPVALFRLPAVPADATDRAAAEAGQDGVIRAIDAGLAPGTRSPEFRMRLHRESGMLFVHGTTEDLDAVRTAVRALPASAGVRESRSASGS